jgi:hypothetical protein
VLAHGQVVTTDLAVALFVFLSVIAFQAVTHRVTAMRVLLAGLATGAAFASKFSALVLVPTLSILAVMAALSPEPLTLAPFAAVPDPPRIVGEVRPGELVAVSATNLQGVYFEGAERHLMNRLRALTPIDRVGYSIFIFRPGFSASVPVP